MYTQTWSKYLPIIKILLKKSIKGDQILNMNETDFRRAGAGRKVGYKLNVQFSNGRANNIINSQQLAKDLSFTLLEDDVIKELFTQNEYHISMNTKFQLDIKFIPKVPVEEEASIEEAVIASA